MTVRSIISALAEFQEDNRFKTGDNSSDQTNLGILKNTSRILVLTADGALIVQDKPGFFGKIKEFLFGSTVNRDLKVISKYVVDALNSATSNELNSSNHLQLKAARVALEVLLAQTTDGYRKTEFTTVFRMIDSALGVSYRASLLNNTDIKYLLN